MEDSHLSDSFISPFTGDLQERPLMEYINDEEARLLAVEICDPVVDSLLATVYGAWFNVRDQQIREAARKKRSDMAKVEPSVNHAVRVFDVLFLFKALKEAARVWRSDVSYSAVGGPQKRSVVGRAEAAVIIENVRLPETKRLLDFFVSTIDNADYEPEAEFDLEHACQILIFNLEDESILRLVLEGRVTTDPDVFF